jgi:hypothetical protein
MIGFDSATRESCTVREARTNTPTQALNLMNDVTFLEAARVMAQRVLRESPGGDAERLAYAFSLAVTRKPSEQEIHALRGSLDHYRRRYASDRDAALNILKQGESPREPSLEVAEHAAWSVVCSLILNLDETVTLH